MSFYEYYKPSSKTYLKITLAIRSTIASILYIGASYDLKEAPIAVPIAAKRNMMKLDDLLIK